MEFSTSPELRSIVTDALKYTENNLRRLASVKSRLAIKNCPNEIKLIIDRYFEAEFDRLRKIKEKENAPEYEKLYDAPEDDELSMEDAIKIEKASWINTARLLEGTEDFSPSDFEPVKSDFLNDDEEGSEPTPDLPFSGTSDCDSELNDYGLLELEISFIGELVSGRGEAAVLLCSSASLLPDSVVEHINEVFFDRLGDIIIEFDGESYVIIEDYLEEVSQWLSSVAK